MRILAADTSTMAGSLALLEDENIVAEWSVRSAQTHNRRLLHAIDTLLRANEWTVDSIDAFAVASGPGSFTGLRIGMTTIKMLAWTKHRLYAAVPSLHALAFPLSSAGLPVCPLIDARKGEVYCAIFRPDGNGNLQFSSPSLVLSPAELASRIDEPVLFCGDGWLRYKDSIRQQLGKLAVEPSSLFHTIRAAAIGELARRKLTEGQSDNPATCAPLYVRPSEAELRYPHLAEKSSGKPEII